MAGVPATPTAKTCREYPATLLGYRYQET
jgi:hypothetical protein